jgi:sugar lactone lactonase YvrE
VGDRAIDVTYLGSRQRALRVALVACLALMGCFAFTARTSAATVYSPTGGQFDGEPEPNAAIAVDPVSGDVLGPPKVNSEGVPGLGIWTPEGAGAAYAETFEESELGLVRYIAIDQASRSIYVGDVTNGRIEKYAISGSSTLTFAPDSSFTSPSQGSAAGQIGDFSSPLAVDPTTGDLLVADNGNHRVSRFGPDGNFISSFTGSDSSAGSFHELNSIAVNSEGQIYVVDLPQGSFPTSPSTLERYTSAGVAENGFSPAVEFPRQVAADPDSGNVLVEGRNDGALSANHPSRLYSLNDDEVLQEVDLPESSNGLLANAVAAGAGRVYVNTQRFGGTAAAEPFIFQGLTAPDVTVGTPSATATTATISGTINPLGFPTSYHLEYSREGGTPEETSETPIGDAPNSTEPFSVELMNLLPNSQYTARVVASNGQASIKSSPSTFETSVAAPFVVTGAAPNPTATTVELVGTVNPLGQQTTYYFEYGTSSAYGNRVPVDHESVAGNGRTTLTVSQEAVGLAPGTAYHFRLVAKNAAGASVGEDRTFSTAPAGAPTRAYELVTPNVKGNANAFGLFLHASPSGDAITYEMQNVIPGSGGAFPKFPRYTSTRMATGWRTVGLEPRNDQTFQGQVIAMDVAAVSEDGTKAVVLSSAVLAPGGEPAGTNIYLYDIATGTYETILGKSAPAAFNWWIGIHPGGARLVVGGTPDFSRIYLDNGTLGELGEYELAEGVTKPSLYEWTKAGGFKVVSEETRADNNLSLREPRYVSEDGSVAYYEKGEQFAPGPVWVNDHGQQLQVSQEPAVLGPASADGRYEAYEEGGNIYRYDLDTRSSTLIVGGATEVLAISRDGSTIYYYGGGGPGGSEGYSVWHEGQIHFVAARTTVGESPFFSSSPNGRFALFSSANPLTGFDSEGIEELYRYDANTQIITCASCRRDGGRPTGEPSAGEILQYFEFYRPRAILDNGEVFFNTPDPLAPADINSVEDVYSFDGQNQTLISPGTGNSNSVFGDASESGENVFFVTGNRLVKGDTNDDVDVYDARIEGGFQSQNEEPPGSPCLATGCRGLAASAPALPSVGSEASGIAQAPRSVRHGKKTCHIGKAKGKKSGRAKCGNGRGHKKHTRAHRGQGR